MNKEYKWFLNNQYGFVQWTLFEVISCPIFDNFEMHTSVLSLQQANAMSLSSIVFAERSLLNVL